MGKKEVATGSAKNAKELLEKESNVLTEKNAGVKELGTDGNADKKTEPQEMDAAKEEGRAQKENEIKEEKAKEVDEGKESKKRKKAKIVEDIVKENKEEQKTPVALELERPLALERPVRERKSVARLVATYEIDAAKEVYITKGRGTALKDIPNVAYKLSKRKTDETFKLLHTIVFGRRAKASQIKNNVSRFSGFAWDETEEKENKKVKERLDRCVKEKLLDICDVLDIPIPRATTKKEDIVTKLIEFLGAPHPTTTDLLSEKEQSSKGNKRKRVTIGSASTPGSSKRSAKSRKGVEESSKRDEKKVESEANDIEEKQEEPQEGVQETVNEVPKISDDEKPEHNKSEEKEAEHTKVSEEDTKKRKRASKKESKEKAKMKKITYSKESSPVPENVPGKSTSGGLSKCKDLSETSPKSSSKMKGKKVEIKKNSPKKSATKEKTVQGKKVAKGKEPKEDKMSPSDEELKKSICELLKEADFNTVTFNDILKQLGKQFNTDLMRRKSAIKAMIQAELTKIANEGDEEDED